MKNIGRIAGTVSFALTLRFGDLEALKPDPVCSSVRCTAGDQSKAALFLLFVDGAVEKGHIFIFRGWANLKVRDAAV